MATEGVWCFVICFGMTGQSQAVPLDTYCQVYEQVVRSNGELGEVRKLPRTVRDRIQGNDLDYLCRCKGLKDARCQGSTQP